MTNATYIGRLLLELHWISCVTMRNFVKNDLNTQINVSLLLLQL